MSADNKGGKSLPGRHAPIFGSNSVATASPDVAHNVLSAKRAELKTGGMDGTRTRDLLRDRQTL